ncbi:MAG: hypothetical protein ACKOBP_13605, partial [Planctomycetia bacterium]
MLTSRRLSALLLLVVVGSLAAPAARLLAQPGAVESPPGRRAAGMPKVPPVPEGTPEQLMAFVEGLNDTDARPTSRQEMMAYMRDVSAASVQVADKILAQVKPGQKYHDEAATLKLESL